MLEIKLSDSRIDSFISALQGKNSELLEAENNLRIKLGAAELDAAYKNEKYEIEHEAHIHTTTALNSTKDKLHEVQLNLIRAKASQKTAWIIIGSVGAALIGGIIIAVVVK